jgi:hypothetical protein
MSSFFADFRPGRCRHKLGEVVLIVARSLLARVESALFVMSKPAARKKTSDDAWQKLSTSEARRQLESFIEKYTPEVAGVARLALARMRKRLPGAVELVYDNYNALAIGFGPSERASEALFSIALCPRWVNFFLLRGASLADPHHILQGKGNQARHIRLQHGHDLDRPAIKSLIDTTIRGATVPIDPNRRGQTVIRAVLAKQRPRRPAEKKEKAKEEKKKK